MISQPIEPGNEDHRLRDVVALSTLPAIWLNANPERVAESLAAALFATVSPSVIYVCLQYSANEAPAVAAQIARTETSAEFAEALGPAISDWALKHDPDDMMVVSNPVGPGTLSITTRPLGIGAEWGVIAAGFTTETSPDAFRHLLLNVAATQAATVVQNMRLLGSLRQSIVEKDESQAKERRAREEMESLHGISRVLAGELNLESLVQSVTDAVTHLSGAKFGAFFYNVEDGQNETYMLYTLSGAPREAFEGFGMPRNSCLFEPTFRGKDSIRLDDVHCDARYGKNPPHYGMPKGHLPVRSYLAVPVISRSGEVLGGLFLGHPDPGVFSEEAERAVSAVAGHAAIAIDNAHLFTQAQKEIAERKRHEEHQKLLLDELNHRVKNTLATVQSIALQTLRGDMPIAEEREALQARLAAMSHVHDLLTETNWQGADMRKVVLRQLAPYGVDSSNRFAVSGPDVRLQAKAALTLGIAFHELATNAAKYGALSNGTGCIQVVWDISTETDPGTLQIRWRESGGPPVSFPQRRGFGSMMIERAVSYDLGGDVRLLYEPDGVDCVIDLELSIAQGL